MIFVELRAVIKHELFSSIMFTSFFRNQKINYKCNICHAEFINMQVILTDGDPCTLRNMKENMELNNLCIEQEDSRVLKESKNKVA